MTKQQLPIELRGVFAPRLSRTKGAQNWPTEGACILYTKGFETWKFFDTPDGVDDLILDTLIDLANNTYQPINGGEWVQANRRGVRFAAAHRRHAPGTVHVVTGIEWTERDGQQEWAIIYRYQFDGPPPENI